MLQRNALLNKLTMSSREELAGSHGCNISTPKIHSVGTTQKDSPTETRTLRKSTTTSGKLSKCENEISPCSEDKVTFLGNPIGSLNELCMSHRWPFPSYEMVNDEDMPPKLLYNIVCKVLDQKTVGTGTSKKVAKRIAAYKMWEKLQDMPTISSTKTAEINDDDQIEQRVENIRKFYSTLKVEETTSPRISYNQRKSQINKIPKQSFEEEPSDLQNSSIGDSEFNYVEFLENLSSKKGFHVTYVEIEEKTISGKSQCLVQLTTFPVAVCCGAGMKYEDAQSRAAQEALEYLQYIANN